MARNSLGVQIARPRDELAVERRLAALERTVAGMAERLAALEPLADVEAVRIIAEATAGHVFSASELLAHQAIDLELRRALRGLRTPRQVGKRLEVLAGRLLGPYLLRRVDRNGAGTIWCASVRHLHEGPSLRGAGGVE